MTRMSGFLEVTLCMYNSFVYLRKECLDGVVNKSAVCSVSEHTLLTLKEHCHSIMPVDYLQLRPRSCTRPTVKQLQVVV